jgi:hypothetical protein
MVFRVPISGGIYTTSSNGCSQNSFGFRSTQASGFLTDSEGFGGTCEKGSFGSLLKLGNTFITTSISAPTACTTRALRAVAASAATSIAAVIAIIVMA